MQKKSVLVSLLLVLALVLSMVPSASAAPASAGMACAQTYTIAAADWLSKLSDKFYGSILAYWPLMAATNQKNLEDKTFAHIDNADLIDVGWKLCVPSKADAEAFLKTFDPNNPAALFGSGAKGQLVVGSWWTNAGEFAGLNEIFKQYKTQNPDVEIVNATIAGGAGTNFKGQLLTQLIGGKAPDSFQLHAGLEVETYSPGTYVVPVDDIYTSAGFEKVFPKDLLAMLKYKDHYWGVPVNIHRSNVLWYNKTLFAKAGIAAAPATWDEFFATADKLKAAGVAPVALGGKDGFELQHTFEDILAGTLGAEGYKGLWTGKTKWSDAKVTDALNTFKKYISYANADHDALTWAAATQLVIDGKAAMNIMGDWANGQFTAAKSTDYGWASSPGTKGIFVALSDSFALPAKAPNPANAKAWIAQAGSKAAQEAFNPLKGSICARTDCDLSKFNDYLKSSAADWAKDAIVPSVTHGAAATPKWATKGYADAVVLFATSGDVAKAQAALVAAAVDAGFPQ
ncbi:MAG: carbohydrate ABC transporter substrate-binding protein [Chloroflexi bacterium]|nr:carbohydrate ABC transporter substrate-binding protein [Chloroflexota bacterium]